MESCDEVICADEKAMGGSVLCGGNKRIAANGNIVGIHSRVLGVDNLGGGGGAGCMVP